MTLEQWNAMNWQPLNKTMVYVVLGQFRGGARVQVWDRSSDLVCSVQVGGSLVHELTPAQIRAKLRRQDEFDWSPL